MLCNMNDLIVTERHWCHCHTQNVINSTVMELYWCLCQTQRVIKLRRQMTHPEISAKNRNDRECNWQVLITLVICETNYKWTQRLALQ